MLPEEQGGGGVLINDNSDTIVLIHYKEAGSDVWDHEYVNFDRVPIKGEYFQMERDGFWYEVKLVLHMAFPLDYDAEIYAVRVPDRFEILKQL